MFLNVFLLEGQQIHILCWKDLGSFRNFLEDGIPLESPLGPLNGERFLLFLDVLVSADIFLEVQGFPRPDFSSDIIEGVLIILEQGIVEQFIAVDHPADVSCPYIF